MYDLISQAFQSIWSTWKVSYRSRKRFARSELERRGLTTLGLCQTHNAIPNKDERIVCCSQTNMYIFSVQAIDTSYIGISTQPKHDHLESMGTPES
jgi:hypothetical protein